MLVCRLKVMFSYNFLSIRNLTKNPQQKKKSLCSAAFQNNICCDIRCKLPLHKIANSTFQFVSGNKCKNTLFEYNYNDVYIHSRPCRLRSHEAGKVDCDLIKILIKFTQYYSLKNTKRCKSLDIHACTLNWSSYNQLFKSKLFLSMTLATINKKRRKKSFLKER